MAKVISLHSFRGGTGKSNITANLSTMLALAGKRVGIVDTDIQSPGIHVIFGLGEERVDHTLNDYLWERCQITESAYDVTPPQVADGKVFLVPSSIKVNEISRVLYEGYDARMLKDGFKELIQEFDLDYLLIDTHLSIAISHILIIILRPDQQDYQGTSVTLEVAKKLGVPNMFLVLNKVLPDLDPEAYRTQLRETYDTAVGAVLPLSTEMVRLASSDVFCLLEPQHPFSQEVKALGQTVIAME
jgi:MinD-like ATPase involved in chromosome partitioning or flagellar assembly